MQKTIKTKQPYLRLAFVIVVALLVMLLSVGIGALSITAKADTEYTDALTDLQQDTTFNVADYPDAANDYSISVIQLAESEGGEVFIYTYQPAQRTKYLVATDVNIAYSADVTGTRLQKLTLISSVGTLCKYKLNDYAVAASSPRYYNISAIYRAWDSTIDEESGTDNEITGKAYPVGQLWTVSGSGDNLTYTMTEQQVIEILNPYLGLCRYKDGIQGNNGVNYGYWVYTDSHYIAFNTNLDMDKLIEVELDYKTQIYRLVITQHVGGRESVKIDEPFANYPVEDKRLTVTSDDVGGNLARNWKKHPSDGNKHEYPRIQKTEDFIKSEDLTSEAKTNLSGLSWVVRFAETSFTREVIPASQADKDVECRYSHMSEVTILRLKFEQNGRVYNLGAVADKITGTFTPDNNPDKLIHKKPWWFWLIVILLIMIALPILSAIFPIVGVVLKSVITVLVNVVKYLFTGLWWLVCLPFRGVAALVQTIKDKKGGGVS